MAGLQFIQTTGQTKISITEFQMHSQEMKGEDLFPAWQMLER